LACHAQKKLFSNVPSAIGVGVKQKSSAEAQSSVFKPGRRVHPRFPTIQNRVIARYVSCVKS
jgi:hypothetical protein